LMAGNCRMQSYISRECNDELRDFLEVTTLYKSKNWMEAADDFKVEYDRSSPWRFSNVGPGTGPDTEVYNVYPIQRYKAGPKHEILGHEDPDDDGSYRHGDKPHGRCSHHHWKKKHEKTGWKGCCR